MMDMSDANMKGKWWTGWCSWSEGNNSGSQDELLNVFLLDGSFLIHDTTLLMDCCGHLSVKNEIIWTNLCRRMRCSDDIL